MAALRRTATVLHLSPGNGGAHYALGMALLLRGDGAGALAEMEQETSEIWRMLGLPMAYHALGRESDSDAALAALITQYGNDAPANVARVYAFRGEADRDPRCVPLLRKLGMAPEQLAAIKFDVKVPQ